MKVFRNALFSILLVGIAAGLLVQPGDASTLAEPANEESIYLPAIVAVGGSATQPPQASPTPTSPAPVPTSTPSPTPQQTTQPPLLVIPNGDFEAGPGNGWTEFAPDGQIIVNQPLLGAEDRLRESSHHGASDPRQRISEERLNAGDWYARLGGDHLLGETPNWQSKLVQNQWMTLPAGEKIYLHFVYQIISEEEPDRYGLCVRDLLNFWINIPGTSILHYQAQICRDFNTEGWTAAVIEISSFAGQNVAFEFEMRTDHDAVSTVLLDDLVLRSTP